MNQWVARHPPWIVTALQLCYIPQLVLHLGSKEKKYRCYHWLGGKIEIRSNNLLARDGTHPLNDAFNDLMHTLQWRQLTAATLVGLQAPPRSLVAYQSRHPVHLDGNVFKNFGFDNFCNTMIFADRHVSPLVLSFGMARNAHRCRIGTQIRSSNEPMRVE